VDELLDAATDADGATSQADVGMDLPVDTDPAPSPAPSPMPDAKREGDGVAPGFFAAPLVAAADGAPVAKEALDEAVQAAIRSTDDPTPSPSHKSGYNSGAGVFLYPYQLVGGNNEYNQWYKNYVHLPQQPASDGGHSGVGTGQWMPSMQGGSPNPPPAGNQEQHEEGMHPPNPETTEWLSGAMG